MKNINEIVADNLSRLMDHVPELDSQGKLHKKSKVAQSTIGRTLRKETSITVENLASIAYAFELQPWQLLVPDLDPSNPQALREINGNEKEFYKKLMALAKEYEKKE